MMKNMRSDQPKPWAVNNQQARRQALFAAVREAARHFFDDSGRCTVRSDHQHPLDHRKRKPAPPFYPREIVHAAMAFFEGNAEDAELANRILARARFHSCDFTTMSLIEMVLRYPVRLAPFNRKKILRHAAREVEHVRRPHNMFNGYNDNFPAMGTFILAVGGELLKNRVAVEAGLDNLYSLRDLLTRRGFFSEYNSPTYGGVSLHGLEETAHHARHPEIRRLAREGAERMWLDIALHWHPEISWHAGPHSRSYHGNSIAWDGLTAILLWVAFGDVIVPGPFRTIFGPAAEQSFEKRSGTLPFCQAGCGGYVGTILRIPDDIGRLVLAKRYPYRVKGTHEFGTFHEGEYRRLKNGAVVHVPGRCADFGAGSANLCTYMERDFAVGTATQSFLGGGQCELFYVIHRRTPRVRRWGDMRAVFARYIVNDLQPEDPKAHLGKGLVMQQGVGFAVQDDRRALVIYHPKGYPHEGIRSLKLTLILQELTGPIDEIWIGDRRLRDGDGEARHADWVILCDGGVLLAFLPLPSSDLGRRVAVRSVRENGYRVISFYNYEGRARDFAPHELKRVQNGFIFEASTLREHRSVPSFLKDLRRAETVDATLMETRRVRYLRDGRELFLWLDPLQQGVKTAAVNGQQVAYPPLCADGLNLARVPWLGQGVVHRNLAWWRRAHARPDIRGLEGVSGRLVS